MDTLKDSHRAKVFYEAIQGIDLVEFANYKMHYDTLCLVLKDLNLLDAYFDTDAFFHNEIMVVHNNTEKQERVRLAIEQAGVELDADVLEKIVDSVSEHFDLKLNK